MDEQGNKSSDGENSTQSDLASKKFMKQNDRVSASSSVTPPLSFDLPGTASGSTATSIHNITPYKSKSESIIRVHERLTESFAMTSISFTGNMSGNRNEARHNDINSSDAAGSPKLKKPSHVSFVMEETSKEEEQKQTNTELETRIDLPILNLEELNNLEVNDGKAVQNKSEQLLIPRESMSSISSNVCRICMTAGKERLISPCNCKGSLANVHLSCLERWLNQVGRNYCELCGFCYPAVRTPRYTMLQALRLWFCNPRNRTHLQSDCLIFWLLTTVTAGLLSVCIVGTQYFAVEGNRYHRSAAHSRSSGISQRVSESAMDFFMAIIICGYSMTVYLLWKDHYVMWSRWRRANVNVRLLIQRDHSESVAFNPRTRTRTHVV